ncbi:MAG: ferredoxin family protein [Polyangiales bacterium]
MLELIIASRCSGCMSCVEACPTNVLEIGAAGRPVIARVEQCQTCFMCELYCESDALYVGPDREKREPVEEARILASGLLGQVRRDYGWDEWANDPRYKSEYWQLGPYLSAGMKQQAERVGARLAQRESQRSASATQSEPPIGISASLKS